MTDDSVAEGGRTGGHADPGRRDRIIDACLEVIAEAGVAGTSHRKVAARAGVPLGSMTYHFSGMDQLLREAFTRFAECGADSFDEQMAQARTPTEALDLVTRAIVEESAPDELVLTHELYTLAAREPAFRDITERWMARTRASFERRFDPLTARLLDALMEGLGIHQSLDREPAATADIVEGIRRITQS